jgi:dTDP-4-dehydrorhamnose 3,5-epimerase
VFPDGRGSFFETFKASEYAANGVPSNFVQDNHSVSVAGVLRGIHFQSPPFAQGKLVRVVRGRVWDVAVDLRPQSPTFGQWFALELSEENRTQLYLPEGFGHGFVDLFVAQGHVLFDRAADAAPRASRARLAGHRVLRENRAPRPLHSALHL